MVFWPQEPVEVPREEVPDHFTLNDATDLIKTFNLPTYSSGVWYGYLNVLGVIKIGNNIIRSNHKKITVCGQHWFALEVNWVRIAWDEVALDSVWNEYIERIER